MNDDEKHLATARAVEGVLPNVAAVLRESVGKRYTAESLEDIAQHFDQRAAQAQQNAERFPISRREYMADRDTWREAARILRATKLKGL